MFSKSLAVAVVVTGLAVPLAAAPATAATRTRDLDAGKQRCETAIDVRLAELTKLDARITGAKNLTDAHRSTLTSTNATARSGLSELRTKIAGDADAATLTADCKAIVTDYRIFALRAPQEGIVIADDAETAAIAKLQALEPKLSDAIDKAEAAGADMTAAKRALTDLEAKVTDASHLSAGVADQVIGFQPSDYNANHDLLTSARTAVKSAAVDLKAARADAKTIVEAVKSAKAAK